MSADRWSACPMCNSTDQKKLDAMRKAHAESYGKATKAEYDQKTTDIEILVAKVSASEGEAETQLREDWEITRDGYILEFSYRCTCYKCGFNYKIEQKWGEEAAAGFPRADVTPYETRASKALAARRTNGR